MELASGAMIAGRYRVDRKIGAGGMGEVWLGDHDGAPVALKMLLPAASKNHEIVTRFKREALILERITSPYVARVIDFVADDDLGLVLVMEFVDGDSLARVLGERVLSVEETVHLGVDIATALCDLHRVHIVHRDLKPGNIMLSRLADGTRRAVVVDFGVSRLTSAGDAEEDSITGITRVGMAVGTIEYMAPEQILNSREVTVVADLYATGAILYRAVAGKHIYGSVPSDGELARRKLMIDAPPLPLTRTDALAVAFAEVVMRALKRRPADRYQTAEELLAALRPLLELAGPAPIDPERRPSMAPRSSQQIAAAAQPKKKPRPSDAELRAADDDEPHGIATPLAPRPNAAPIRVAPPAQPSADALRTTVTSAPRVKVGEVTPVRRAPPVIAGAGASASKRGIRAGVLIGTVLGIALGTALATFAGRGGPRAGAPQSQPEPHRR